MLADDYIEEYLERLSDTFYELNKNTKEDFLEELREILERYE